MLGLEPGDVRLDAGLCPVPLQEAARPRAGIAEQRSVDELDGRRRALDVEEDGAGLLQRDAVRSGM